MTAFQRFIPTSVLFTVLFWSLGVAGYSAVAVWKERGPYAEFADLPSGLEAAISLVIGLLLAFRANRAFERWWEARTLWGTLVNASRNLAVKANNIVTGRDESFDRFAHLLCAFPEVLRDHLRDGATWDGIEPFSDKQLQCQHPPSYLVNQMYGILEQWKREQRIYYGEFWMLDRELKVLLEVCGGCERIRNTPIAPSFHIFLNHAITVFLLTLPWGIVNDLGVWTIPIVFLTSYFIMAAEGIAAHIEQPFEKRGDGLNLDAICLAIHTSVTEIFATETIAQPSIGESQ